MENKEMIIAGLQGIVTGLAQQADGHMIQSRVFAAQGLTKLADKYTEHAEEERGYVQQCVDRILDLGGTVKNQTKQETPVYTDAIEWIKYDLQVSIDGLAGLDQLLACAKDDVTTYDILKDYYKDEEADLYWGEQQLELIEKIGTQYWYAQQI